MQTTDLLDEDFLAFARGKPEGEVFNWFDLRNCALAQYGKHVARPGEAVIAGTTIRIFSEPGEPDRLILQPSDHVLEVVSANRESTWGRVVRELEVAL